jgi:O-glycosyl hydrolase
MPVTFLASGGHFMKFLVVVLLVISIPLFAQQKMPLVVTIQVNDTVQCIRNFGAAGCWYTEEIGKEWPANQKQKIARLLFSRETNRNGQPKGIGLSAFRYNIGGGSAEQGDSGGIKDPSHRVECFLAADGTYNWNKQEGYTWMLSQAKKYGVQDLIAFVNSPPVQFTKNGYAFKTEKDFVSNLREDKYEAYVKFLSEVLKQFDKKGLHFNYISPVNEPQWDWIGTPGQAKQEGSPWTNEEIFRVVKFLSRELNGQKQSTRILITEAAMLDHLTGGNGKATRQIAQFWDPQSSLYIGALPNTTPYVEGHGYFTDNGDRNLIRARARVRDTLKKYGNGLEYWQSEYCMLGDGYKEGSKEQRIPAIDCALFLAKMIHHDLTIGNATAWHYWNSYEPGPADSNIRYYMIALNRDRKTDTANMFAVTKNLWALGHYSLLVRPGMYRLVTKRNDTLADTAIAQELMVSAFRDAKAETMVVNLINYTSAQQAITLVMQDTNTDRNWKLNKRYQTTAKNGEDMKPIAVSKRSSGIGGQTLELPARSITSLIFK